MAETLKIICPKCDKVIAVAPEVGLVDTDLLCSGCGAKLRAPDLVEKTADKVKTLLKDAERKISEKVGQD